MSLKTWTRLRLPCKATRPFPLSNRWLAALRIASSQATADSHDGAISFPHIEIRHSHPGYFRMNSQPPLGVFVSVSAACKEVRKNERGPCVGELGLRMTIVILAQNLTDKRYPMPTECTARERPLLKKQRSRLI